MLNLDFSSVKGFDPVPEEDYVLRIEKCEEKSSQAGNPMLNVTFQIMDGEFAERKIFESYVLTEKCLWKLRQLLSVIGIEADGAIDLDTNELLGKCITGSVIIEEYNGQERNKIKTHKKAPEEFQLI